MHPPINKIHRLIVMMGVCILGMTLVPALSWAQSDNTTTQNVNGQGPSLAQLMAKLFQNPADLELNFQVMQAQITEGNLEGAEATLERGVVY